MKHQIIFVSTLLVLVFSSCAKEDNIATDKINAATTAEVRTSQNIVLKIAQSNESIVDLTVSKYAVSYTSGNYFSVVVNPGTESEQSYTASSIMASHTSNGLKIIKDANTSNQVTYQDKSKCILNVIDQNSLSISINDGAVVTTGINIVGEEMGGL